MSRRLIVAIPLLSLVALLAWIFRPRHESLGEAFVSDQSVMLWSSVAQVRQSLATLHYGERGEALSRRNNITKCGRARGLLGWGMGGCRLGPRPGRPGGRLLPR